MILYPLFILVRGNINRKNKYYLINIYKLKYIYINLLMLTHYKSILDIELTILDKNSIRIMELVRHQINKLINK